MSIFFPENKISEIQNAADIVDIISEVVLLKKAGRNYVGLCPFHSEKTPSFTINPEKQIFHCFGCGVGGNVFHFLMKHGNISFPDSVMMLSKKYSIEVLNENISFEQKKQINERENMLNTNKKAMEFFQFNLSGNIGKVALEYLKKRGLSDETIKIFYIGYAPESWDSLVDYFVKNRIQLDFADKVGLIVKRKETSGFYDRFRNRVMFPIFDINNQVIGFGGRVLDNSQPNKYLNSPESLVYNKSRSLYGLNTAKSICREKKSVYVVEGYVDLLALHQHGIKNAVATLGTALTVEHVRLLKGYAGRINLVYDSDEAGIKASQKSISLFIKEQMDARIIILPAGYDPDSYLFEFGTESFKRILDNGMSLISFLIDYAIKKHGLSIEGKVNIVSELKDTIFQIDNKVAKSLYIKELAERIDISEFVILENIKDNKTRNLNRNRNQSLYSEYMPEGIAKKSESYRIEKRIVTMMLQFQEILPEINKRGIIELFEDDNFKSIGKCILDSKKNNNKNVLPITVLMDNQEISRIITSLSMEEEKWEYNGCLKLITQFESRRHNQEKNLLKEIKAAEDSNDQDLLMNLLQKKQDLARKKICSNNF